jgi:hypothetical protein
VGDAGVVVVDPHVAGEGELAAGTDLHQPPRRPIGSGRKAAMSARPRYQPSSGGIEKVASSVSRH